MHADGYAGFNALYRSGAIEEVARMAHIRRKFVDLFQSQTSGIAEEAIRRIAGLYGVEKRARDQVPEERVHRPWEASQDVQKKAMVTLGETYPVPIVDHKAARARAPAAYEEVKKAK